jgi:GNAT superfamily N-acetyltransferase
MSGYIYTNSYNYLQHLEEDIENVLGDYLDIENIDDCEMSRATVENMLYENLWTDDSVTGNGLGSYTFNAALAEEYLEGNWELASEAYREFGYDEEDIFAKGPEAADVTIRCYLLSQAISNVLDSIGLLY